MSGDEPSVGDHFRVTDSGNGDGLDPGVYRVVGTTDATGTLLEVANAEDRRVHTGRVVTVDGSTLGGLDPADNPDENRSAAERVDDAVEGFKLSAWAFWRSLAARPVPSALAFAVFAIGEFGGRVLDGPNLLFGALIILGGLGLVYLGSLGE